MDVGASCVRAIFGDVSEFDGVLRNVWGLCAGGNKAADVIPAFTEMTRFTAFSLRAACFYLCCLFDDSSNGADLIGNAVAFSARQKNRSSFWASSWQ
jgi:hypothetical protein